MKKVKISLVSLLLFVALLGAIVEIVLRRAENQSLTKQRDELLEASVRIDATDKSKIYVRRLPSVVPMVFRFQVAYPLGKNWRVKTIGGELSQDGEKKLTQISGSSLNLNDFKPGETHKQGVVTIYFRKQSGRYMLISSTENGGGGGSLSANLDEWMAQMFRYPSPKLMVRSSKKHPVETFPANKQAPLLQLLEPQTMDVNGNLKNPGRKFLNISVAAEN